MVNMIQTQISLQSDKQENMMDSGGVRFLPWVRCIMGCDIEENSEVTLLSCFHAVCSDLCMQRLRATLKSGKKLSCRSCKKLITPEHITSNKINLKKAFRAKKSLDEVNLICDNCVWGRPAAALCKNCAFCLCEQCADFHMQTRMTQTHQLDYNLDDWRKKQHRNDLDADTKCQLENHGNSPLVYYCENCDIKFCSTCTPSHIEHTIFNISIERQELSSKMDIATNVISKCNKTIDGLVRRHRELATDEWKKAHKLMAEQYAILFAICENEFKKSQQDLKKLFDSQFVIMEKKIRNTLKLRKFAEDFLLVAKDLNNNRDDVAVVNLLRFCQKDEDLLSEVDKFYTADMDQILETDWHFQPDVDVANSRGEIETIAKRFGKFSYKPLSSSQVTSTKPKVRKSMVPSVAKIVAAKAAARQVAVKRTGLPQMSPKKRKIVGKRKPISLPRVESPLPPYSGSGSSSPSSSSVSTEELIERRNDSGIEEITSTVANNIKKPENENGVITASASVSDEEDAMEVDNVDMSPQLSETNSCGKGNGKDEELKEVEEKREKRTSTSPPPPLESNEVEMTFDGSVPELEEMPVLTPSPLTATGSEFKLNEDSLKSSCSNDSSSEVSTSSLAFAEPSQRREGKRERKFKGHPEMIYTETAYGLAYLGLTLKTPTKKPKRSSINQNSSGRPSSPRMPTLQEYENQEDIILDDEVENPLKQSGDAKFDNGVDSLIESSDTDVSQSESESSNSNHVRRRSLRRRTFVAPVPPVCLSPDVQQKPPRGISKETEKKLFDEALFQEAPLSSLEELPSLNDFPVQDPEKMKITHIDDNEDYCCICRDGGDDIIICCDFCPKVFHPKCHIPVITEIPNDDEKWHCNYDTTKESVEELISQSTNEGDIENEELVESNRKHFPLACKFVMECYKIPEIPTVRWLFPHQYIDRFGKAPFHLKYIRERLSPGTPTHFSSVEDMLTAFRQMFIQAFIYYTKKQKFRAEAVRCFQQFLMLVDVYYPQHKAMFNGILQD